MSNYVLRTAEDGAARLEILSRVMWPATRAHLERAGLRAGMHCLDVGCGAGSVSTEIVRLAQPGGSVTGWDADAVNVERARRESAAKGFPSRFLAGDVMDLHFEGEFDLVFARFLLSHLTDPLRALERMLRALRPGGILAVEDIDFPGSVCHPPNRAYDRYVELYQAAVRGRGADPAIGPKLPSLLAAVGALEVEFEIVQPAGLTGEVKRIAPVTMEHIRQAVAGSGLAEHAEIDGVVAELEAFAAAPDTMVGLPRIFQVRGRKAG